MGVVAVQVKGPTRINIGWAASGKTMLASLGAGKTAELGFSRNGVTVLYEPFYLDVPGDENGGDDGPPIDVQWLGGIARGRLDLTKYDPDVLENVLALLPGTGWGQHNTKEVGTLMFTGVQYFQLSLVPTLGGSIGRFFPRCILRSPAEHNYSSKYTNPVLEFEAHVSNLTSTTTGVHGTGVKAAGDSVAI